MALFKRTKPLATGTGSVEELTQQIGRGLIEAARGHAKGFFSSRFWSDKLMEWATKDQGFKVQLFRFIDTFPTLRSAEEIHEYLVDYLSQPGVTLPAGMSMGLKAGGMLKGTLATTISSQIRGMAEKFIAGTNANSALPRLRELWGRGMAFSVDLLGEACVSDEEAHAYQQRYLDLIEKLPGQVAGWPGNAGLETDYLGAIPRANVSIKISSLYARTKAIDTEGSIRGLLEALAPILEAAKKNNVLINFDMEQHELKDLTIALFERACEAFEFPAGIAIQAYLRSAEEDARRLIEWSKRARRQVTVRLIKGAYWDYETIYAEEKGWAAPVWGRKGETDACFERVTKLFVEAMPTSADEGGMKLAVGTHNARSIAHALALVRARGLPNSALEIQMLHGMADELKGAVVDARLRLREYVPIGEMIPGMAYLVRRLLENTSNESWLKAGFMDGGKVEALLAAPMGEASPLRASKKTVAASPAFSLSERGDAGVAATAQPREDVFRNEATRDWSREKVRKDFAGALGAAHVPTVANDSTVEQAREAVGRAVKAFPVWREVAAGERAGVIVKAAGIMRGRRDELASVVVKESGKTWAESDADVCEAIDFCEFYSREAVKLFEPVRLGKFVGEFNQQWHEPRGVAVVISPWNFPMAICCGMTTAALVTGNSAIVKPAEQTPGIARILCEILWEAGVPREVLQFLPGKGETVGAALVRDPRVAVIAFTGSKAVGLDIIRAAGVTGDDQPFVKKVVCEMGGKNAIIVDTSADLDEAVLGVRQSAFSYAGQKCSACSRVIVVDEIHDLFLRRLVESTRALVVGDPRQAATDVGPVIDEEAAGKVWAYIEIGKGEGKLELAVEVLEEVRKKVSKPLIGPHIFSGIRGEHRLAREEIFGPVLAVMRASSFEEALGIANGTAYKLTGGVFSRRPANIERAKREFRVGNLYLNRGITGALVGRQPFGGFGLSGVGSKAGGGEYLLQFVELRVCTENTMRRGFAPGDS